MAVPWATLKDAFAPKPTVTEADVPDLAGQVIIVTGANVGIGKETARILLQHNAATVYLACRSPSKARAAAEDLKTVTGRTDQDMPFLELDLSDLGSVKAGAEAFLARESRLDVLINNAGVMFPPLDQLTKHGHDLQFGTNVLGHYYFTQLLLPILLSTAQNVSPTGKVRVVNVSSTGNFGAVKARDGGPIVYETLVESKRRKKLGTAVMYFQSKAGNVMYSQALHRRYGDQGIVSTSLHPGAINTDLDRSMPGLIRKVNKKITETAAKGAITQIYAATAPEALNFGGKYLHPWARLGENNPELDDIAKQEELWEYLEGEVRKYAPLS